MTTIRTMPDVDALVMQILRPACAPSAVQEIPFPSLAAVLTDGGVVARRIPGGGASGKWGFVDRAVVTVDVWADDRTKALDLAQLCRGALWAAANYQTVYPAGWLSDYEEQSAPAENRNGVQLTGMTQVNAVYQLHCCPPS